MPEITTINEGLVAFAVIVALTANQALSFLRQEVKDRLDSRRGNNLHSTLERMHDSMKSVERKLEEAKENTPFPACHYDPQHFDRIRRMDVAIAELIENKREQQRDIDRGQFSCQITHEHLRALNRLAERTTGDR